MITTAKSTSSMKESEANGRTQLVYTQMYELTIF